MSDSEADDAHVGKPAKKRVAFANASKSKSEKSASSSCVPKTVKRKEVEMEDASDEEPVAPHKVKKRKQSDVDEVLVAEKDPPSKASKTKATRPLSTKCKV